MRNIDEMVEDYHERLWEMEEHYREVHGLGFDITEKGDDDEIKNNE